jgi:predicted nucleotidyltransferase
MQKELLNYLELESKKVYTEKIFDIVLYGSFVKSKENPNDLDIAVVFFDEKLEEQLNFIQLFKSNLKKNTSEFKSVLSNLDLKALNLKELFDKNFIARSGIVVEGYSLLGRELFSFKMGFKGYSVFSYSLKDLNHNQKTKFTYALIGRTQKGILSNLKAIVLGKGAVAIPIEQSYYFEDFLKKWSVSYKIKNSLVAI